MSKKCIILSRVSTYYQDLTQQTDAVIKKAKSEGYDDFILIEDKESGVKLNEEERLGLNKLKSNIIYDKDIKCVFVYEVSRIGRRPDVNFSIRNFLQEHHVQLRVIDPDITLFNDDFTINESGNLMFSIFNSMAENEGWIRKERTMRGKSKAVKENRYIGGGILFGYRKNENGVIEIDPDKATYVRKMFNDYANGTKTTFDIGKEMYELGYISSKTISSCQVVVGRYLKNKRYIGEYQEGKYRYPQIVDPETFNKVNELIMTKRKMLHKKHKFDILLRALVKDKLTGNRAIGKQGGYEVYQKYSDGSPSHFVNIRTDFLDKYVWETLCNKPNLKPFILDLTTPNIEEQQNLLQKKLDATEAKIITLNQQIDKINNRIINNRMREDIGDIEINNRLEQIEDLKVNLSVWRTELDNLNIMSVYNDTTHNLIEIEPDWRNYTDLQKKKDVVEFYIKEILIEKGKVEIVWYDNTSEQFTYNIHKKLFEKVS